MAAPIVVDVGTFSCKYNVSGEQNQPLEQRTLKVRNVSTAKDGTTGDESKTNEQIYYGNKGVEHIKSTANASNAGTNVMESDFFNDHFYGQDNQPETEDWASYLKAILCSDDADQSKFDLGQHSLLLTDTLFSNRKHRGILSEIAFEQWQTPSLYFEVSGVLGLYAMGRTDGLVVDLGHSQSSVIPIVQGYCVETAARKLDFGGKHVDQYLTQLLRKAGVAYSSTAQMEIVREIKERMVSCKPDKAYEKLQDDDQMNCDMFEYQNSKNHFGNLRYRASEVLFGPHLLGLQSQGIHHAILDCINACDLGLRKQLMSTVTLMGGTSLLSGFGKRLMNELVTNDYNRYNYKLMIARSSKDDSDRMFPVISAGASSPSLSSSSLKPQKIDKKTGIRILARQNRKFSAWFGGNVLCSMDEFKNDENLWITQANYKEYGNSILYREIL